MTSLIYYLTQNTRNIDYHSKYRDISISVAHTMTRTFLVNTLVFWKILWITSCAFSLNVSTMKGLMAVNVLKSR